jgi:hypothetical protein
MSYLIILVIIGLALAPLWHFMPTRRQRHQAGMREAAALAGLFVEFRDLPLPDKQRQRLPAVDRQVLYYGRRLKPRRGSPRQRQSWWREGDRWRGTAALPAIAAKVPAAVLALGISDASCGCYWREDGDPGTVREIAEALALWAEESEAG